MSDADRYPRAVAALAALAAHHVQEPSDDGAVPGAFTLGPAVLRAPPPRQRPAAPVLRSDDDDEAGEPAVSDLLGELCDMVLVGAEESGGVPEVHLVFRAEVFSGLHLRLQKRPEGMSATFTVGDEQARRAVQNHIDALLSHLRGRGFSIAAHEIRIGGGT